MDLVRRVIESVDWSDFELIDGPANEFADRLAEFVSDAPIETRTHLWASMENHVFAQDDIYTAAEPTLTVLFAALASGPAEPTRLSILDLVFHIVHAASFRHDELGARCMERAAEASWLLVREALSGSANVTEACVEVLEITAPHYVAIVRPSE